MRKWFDLMMANQEDLAHIMTAEQGKPLAETRGEVAYGASFIEWFAEEGKRIYGDVIPTNAAGPPHHRDEGADRRRRRDHAVEFPQRHDHAQMRARARRGLHLRHQARRRNAAVGAGAGRTCAPRRHSEGRVQCRDVEATRPKSAWS